MIEEKREEGKEEKGKEKREEGEEEKGKEKREEREEEKEEREEEKSRHIQETVENDPLELMLEEQLRNQVRSDYRRSLGSESCRRYME